MKKKKISKKLDLKKKEISSLSAINGGIDPVQGAIPIRPISKLGSCLCMTYEECNSIHINCPV